MNIVYSDIKRFGLCGILPKKKRYGSKKDYRTTEEAIRSRADFVQFALRASGAENINKIITKLARGVINCNDVYYNYIDPVTGKSDSETDSGAGALA